MYLRFPLHQIQISFLSSENLIFPYNNKMLGTLNFPSNNIL